MATTRLRPSIRGVSPNLLVEQEYWNSGESVVAGIDEVGRGAWAGPLTIAVAVLPKRRRIYRVRDSKLLNEHEREALFDRVAEWCDDWAVGHATAAECDRLGMSQAQRLAASRAIGALHRQPDRVLVDGPWDFVARGNSHTIVHGDRTSLSIAAASILAKVTRDRLMRSLSSDLPWYRLERNKGYPSPAHRAALQVWGPSTLHRTSWGFMDKLMWQRRPAIR
ncbi:MAG: ribonuclease HII [Gammaproteobacteria bacterium]|nr:ribonuclease HII [Gammaproteobacteria bacterium]